MTPDTDALRRELADDDSPSPEEIADMQREEEARRAALPRKVEPLPVRGRFYMVECEYCGWIGSSESCGLCRGWDDGDVLCPACDATILADSPSEEDVAEHGEAVFQRIVALQADVARLTEANASLLTKLSDTNLALGDAKGRLLASEAAGVVEACRGRADAAEARITTLSARIESLETVLTEAEAVMARHIYPKPDVGPEHPYSVLLRVRAALSAKIEDARHD